MKKLLVILSAMLLLAACQPKTVTLKMEVEPFDTVGDIFDEQP